MGAITIKNCFSKQRYHSKSVTEGTPHVQSLKLPLKQGATKRLPVASHHHHGNVINKCFMPSRMPEVVLMAEESRVMLLALSELLNYATFGVLKARGT